MSLPTSSKSNSTSDFTDLLIPPESLRNYLLSRIELAVAPHCTHDGIPFISKKSERRRRRFISRAASSPSLQRGVASCHTQNGVLHSQRSTELRRDPDGIRRHSFPSRDGQAGLRRFRACGEMVSFQDPVTSAWGLETADTIQAAVTPGTLLLNSAPAIQPTSRAASSSAPTLKSILRPVRSSHSLELDDRDDDDNWSDCSSDFSFFTPTEPPRSSNPSTTALFSPPIKTVHFDKANLLANRALFVTLGYTTRHLYSTLGARRRREIVNRQVMEAMQTWWVGWLEDQFWARQRRETRAMLLAQLGNRGRRGS